MDSQPVTIMGAVYYSKWKIFGVSCRFFGVKHFFKKEIVPESEYFKFNTCSINSGSIKIDLINYILAKIEENKNIDGVLDFYTEHNFNENSTEINKNLIEEDILYQIDQKLRMCLYGNKNDINFKNVCPFYIKENGDINSRFHYIDIRKSHVTSHYSGLFDLEFNPSLKHPQIINYVLLFLKEAKKMSMTLLSLQNYEKKNFPTNTDISDGYSIFDVEMYDKYVDGMNENRILSQFRKLSNSQTGREILEKIKASISIIFDEKINNIETFFELVKNDPNMIENFFRIKSAESFYDLSENERKIFINNNKFFDYYYDACNTLICILMDLYFLGRFFNNILNAENKSSTVIVVSGNNHIKFYNDVLINMTSKLGSQNEINRLEATARTNTDNCVEINKEEFTFNFSL